MRNFYIKGGDHKAIAVVEDGRLVEYVLDDGNNDTTECIYLGRVERVVSGMQAAFVDIGQEKNGFLPLQENSKTCVVPKLSDGMHVLVQVKKEAQGTKGAFLTRDITLCGAYVLLMPMNRYVGVSSRVSDEAQREGLRAMGHRLADGRFGLVMRNSALYVPEDAVAQEVAELLEKWSFIAQTAPTAHAPSRIYQARTQLETLLADYAPRGIDHIYTDDAALVDALPDHKVEVKTELLMETPGVPAQLERALGRYVWLPSGGNLVIDYCEAMTVIDVNTAKNTGKRDLEMTIVQTNLEACQEIATQVRLRNVSGILLIDFIDMQNESHRQQVLEALEKAFSTDRVKTVIHGFTSLGLVEMTRKKSRAPLRDELTKPCQTCHGSGRVNKQKEESHG